MPSLNATVPLGSFCALLVVMALKHFVADFLFQTGWIAHGKEGRKGWLTPLIVHVLGHGILTLLIALVVAPHLWWLALVDVVIHAAVDRGKATVVNRCYWDFTKAQFWWLLGFDQLLHQITNIALAAAFFLL